MMSRSRPHSGFSDVDRDDPLTLLAQLDWRSHDPFHQAYKRRAFTLLELHDGDRVLDVGCGAGDDVSHLSQLVGPSGSAIGLDASETMISEARRRHAGWLPADTFVIGTAEQLPFSDEHFDGSLAIRTFQHLPDPRRALAEMRRVTRPGGHLVVVDPDHNSAIVDTPERQLMRTFLTFRAGTIRNGGIASQMAALFREGGLLDVTAIPLPDMRSSYADVEAAMHYEAGIGIAREQGVLTTEEADRLLCSIREAASTGKFRWAMTSILTVGRVP